MSSEHERATRRALRRSVVEGMLHAAMLGVSESYLGALAVALGHDAAALALLATVPLLAGAAVQLAVGPLTMLVGGRKRLVVIGATIQAVAHVGFLWIAGEDVRDLAPLLAIKTVFWASGALISPPWGAWMATLVQPEHRQRYFGVRSGLCEAALLGAFLGGGALLHRAGPAVLDAFTVMFVIAMIARATSALLLALQYEPPTTEPWPDRGTLHRIRDAVAHAHWRTAAYLAAVMFGGFVAIPFFTPYMLRDLGLGFGEFAALTAVSIFAKALAFPACHRLAERIGLRRMLAFSGIGIALIPLVWAGFRQHGVLVAAQVLGGVSWAGLEYASFQLLLQSSRPEHRLEFLSLSSALTGTLQLAGSLVGGALLRDLEVGYAAVFVVSAALRGLALVLLVRTVRPLAFVRLPRLFLRLASVRPTGGAFRGPIVEEEESARSDRR